MKNLLLMFTKLAGSHENDVNIFDSIGEKNVQSCVFIYEKLNKRCILWYAGGNIVQFFIDSCLKMSGLNRIVCIFAPNL